MSVDRNVLEQVLAEVADPLLVVRTDQPDWPVVLTNAAFTRIAKQETVGQPFADVVEALIGRELALEVSESVRSRQETSFPAELHNREYLLVLKPLEVANVEAGHFCAAFWRSSAGTVAADGADLHHALLKAKRRIRDLSRDDLVTGLLNARAFREIFEHDWAVAAREKSRLSVVKFVLDDFQAYVDVFGRHASDSCLRRVGQAIRRSLRRASDVVSRPSGACFLALSHASEEEGVREFAARIATAVRELGVHHPRSTTSRFVTVSYEVVVADAANESRSAGRFLDELLGGIAE